MTRTARIMERYRQHVSCMVDKIENGERPLIVAFEEEGYSIIALLGEAN
ncbi:MAG: hypothetical protein ACE5NA_00200 [Nitrospiraceae bacterium]